MLLKVEARDEVRACDTKTWHRVFRPDPEAEHRAKGKERVQRHLRRAKSEFRQQDAPQQASRSGASAGNAGASALKDEA
jgi:hypothetical protein